MQKFFTVLRTFKVEGVKHKLNISKVKKYRRSKCKICLIQKMLKVNCTSFYDSFKKYYNT